MRFQKQPTRRGVTLIEVIIAISISSLLTVSTLASIGQSRLLRAHARDRAEMALLAQSELDRIRRGPALAPGLMTLNPDAATTCTITVTNAMGGLLQIAVDVERERTEGRYATSLIALHGGQP